MPENEPNIQEDANVGWGKTDKGFVNSREKVIDGVLKMGIDVSFYDGEIDWEAVKSGDVEFAILRCGYGKNHKSQDDTKWLDNADTCTRLGIPFGVYLYSYATCPEDAVSEAEHVIRLISGYNLSYPVFYDIEDDVTANSCSNEEIGVIADAFCKTVSDAGYPVGVYAGIKWWDTKLTSKVFDNPAIHKWIAQWMPRCSYNKPFEMWQVTETGTVYGIDDYVDINYLFNDGVDHSMPYQSNMIVFTIDKKEAYAFGEFKTNDVAPVIRNDRTMLPARFFAESLGAEVEWDGEAKKVIITKDDTKIIISVNSDIAYVNNKKVILDSPAFIENDRVYTPLRFIAENLGADITWDEAPRKVIVYTNRSGN